MQALKVSLVQGATRWHDPAGNRDYYASLMAPLAGSDLVLLPETFTSGFSNEAIHNAETMDGPTVAWLRAQARALDAVLAAEGAAALARLPLLGIPQTHRLIFAGAGNHLTIWTDGQCPDSVRMPLQKLATGAARNIPQADRTVGAAADHGCALGVKDG